MPTVVSCSMTSPPVQIDDSASQSWHSMPCDFNVASGRGSPLHLKNSSATSSEEFSGVLRLWDLQIRNPPLACGRVATELPVWHSNWRVQAELPFPARITPVHERPQLAACATGRAMEAGRQGASLPAAAQ